VNNKADEIVDYITDEQIDIMAITETWITPTNVTSQEKVTPSGYNLLHLPRSKRRGGGVAIIYRSTLHVSKQPVTSYQSFEHMEVLLNTGNDCVRISVIYRPPSRQPMSVFFDEFQSYVDSYATTSDKLILMGDFNLHFENESNRDAAKFRDTLFRLNLVQHVVEATHEKGHQLDLVITRSDEDIVREARVCGGILSDHFPVTFLLPWKKPCAPRRTLQRRRLKDIDLDALSRDIENSDLVKCPPDDLSSLITLYNSTLTSIMEEHAPSTTKVVILRPHSPWFNSDIKAAKCQRRKAERRWRVSKLAIDLQLLKERHKHVTTLINNAKKEYYCEKIEEGGSDQKQLFQITNHLLYKKKAIDLPTHTSSLSMADKFVDYFSQKVETICKSLTPATCLQKQSSLVSSISCVTEVPPATSPPPLNTLTSVSEEELSNVILSGNSKSCRLDPLPTTILKSVLPVVLPILVKIVNTSLSTCTMPDKLKCAAVTPLLKKPSLDKEDMKNYRPVSNLQYVGKLIEKVVVSRLDSHLAECKLYEPLQSAYTKNHSVETALLKVSNDILLDIDRKQCVLLVLLDQSAAFDTISHRIFLNRMEDSCSVTGQPLHWLKSYFTNRSQNVYINGQPSKSIALGTGFPQGSNIGPFGFKAYTKPIAAIARKHGVSVLLYADDTQLYLLFHPKDAERAMLCMEECISEISTWLNNNSLKMNNAKTEFVVLGSRSLLASLPKLTLKVGIAQILPTRSARNIGAIFDDTLSMADHVDHVVKTCYFQIRNIAKIRKYLTQEATAKIIQAFVISRLDSLNSLLVGIPQYQLDKLQLIQNNAARVILQQ
jgi:hypothetical protein